MISWHLLGSCAKFTTATSFLHRHQIYRLILEYAISWYKKIYIYIYIELLVGFSSKTHSLRWLLDGHGEPYENENKNQNENIRTIQLSWLIRRRRAKFYLMSN